MNTLVYKYGLRAPHENRDLALADLRLAHEYRNKLIEIERARRARVRLAEDALLGEPRLQARRNRKDFGGRRRGCRQVPRVHAQARRTGRVDRTAQARSLVSSRGELCLSRRPAARPTLVRCLQEEGAPPAMRARYAGGSTTPRRARCSQRRSQSGDQGVPQRFRTVMGHLPPRGRRREAVLQ